MSIRYVFRLITRLKLHINKRFQNRELKQVEQLIQGGNLEESYKKIENMEIKGNLHDEIRITKDLLKSEILIQKEDFEKGLSLAEKSLKDSKESGYKGLEVAAIASKANALLGIGKPDISLDAVEEGENLLKSVKNDQQKNLLAILYQIKGKIYRRKGEIDLTLEYLEKSLSLSEELDDLHGLAGSLNVIGIVHASKGEFDLALKFLQQSLEKYNELGNERIIMRLFNNIGLIYSYKGEMDRALEYYQKSLDLSEKIGNKQVTAALLLNIGLIYTNKGELDLALDYHKRSLAKFKELDWKLETAISLNNIGLSYEGKGELDLALDFFNRSLTLYKELENINDTALSFNNIGNVHLVKGDDELATLYYLKSLNLFEKIGNDSETIVPLHNLISLHANRGSVEDSKQYLQQLQEIHERDSSKIIDQVYRLSKAIILQTSERVINRAEAQKIYQEIAKEEILQHDYTVDAMLRLSELLLQELRSSGNEDVLNEIKTLLQQLAEIGEKQYSYKVLVNTYRLQSRMALLELDIHSSRQSLEKAQQIAEKKGLQKLAVAISAEYDTLLSQLSKWTDFIDQNVSLMERLEFAELEGMVSQIIRKKAEIPEIPTEDPAMLIILSQTGKIHFSRQFQSDKPLDDHVVGDLLIALNNFIQEAFSETGSIERVKHKEHTIVLKPMETLLCCYVFKGQSYSALQKLEKFVEVLKDTRALWNLMTSTTIRDQPLHAEKEINEKITEIFLSPHYQVVLQDIG
ncbi:MAG: tetratricopeptide repeat protein [Candidatus Hodarchaeota archaeon]